MLIKDYGSPDPSTDAAEFLERRGLIKGYDFIPSTAISIAAKILTEQLDEKEDNDVWEKYNGLGWT